MGDKKKADFDQNVSLWSSIPVCSQNILLNPAATLESSITPSPQTVTHHAALWAVRASRPV